MATSLDKIVRSYLLQQGKSIHFYLQSLVYARECLREISLDDLKVVSYKLITLDKYNEAPIPIDCLDVVAVGYGVGQSVRPLVQDNNLNSLISYDTGGNRISYTQPQYASNPRDNFLLGTGSASTWANGWSYNSFSDYGEYLGKWFGYNPSYYDTFKVISERCVIKVNEYVSLNNNQAVLQYISDGTDCNACTMIDSNAIAVIDAYIKWQTKENNRSYGEGEKERARQIYLKQRGILRSRKSDLTIEGIKRSMMQSYTY